MSSFFCPVCHKSISKGHVFCQDDADRVPMELQRQLAKAARHMQATKFTGILTKMQIDARRAALQNYKDLYEKAIDIAKKRRGERK